MQCKPARPSFPHTWPGNETSVVTCSVANVAICGMHNLCMHIAALTCKLYIQHVCMLFTHPQKALQVRRECCYGEAEEERYCMAVVLATCLCADKALLFGATLRCCTTTTDKGRHWLQPSPSWHLPWHILWRRPHERYPCLC